MFFIVRSNDGFNFPLGLIKYIVIVAIVSPKIYRQWNSLLQQIEIITVRIQLRLCLQCAAAEENEMYLIFVCLAF